jgi:BirA family biotin operon repressor/biotin-[acetyl-CoA-carboxylase] ligase
MPADRLDNPTRWQALQPLLAPLDPQALVEHVSDIDSTNTELMRRARAGDTRTCLLLADTQSAGRGRLGRQWHSRPGDALTMSLGLRLAPQSWSGLSLAVGCSLAGALDPHFDKGIGLKWPNDLMLAPWGRPRKLGGILIETVWRQGDAALERFVVIGIGLNLAAPPAADYRTEPVGLRSVLAADISAQDVLHVVLPALVAGLQKFSVHGFASFAAEFARRDVFAGRELQLSTGVHGMADGVDQDGVLWLNTPAGRVSVSSDEVSVRATGVA